MALELDPMRAFYASHVPPKASALLDQAMTVYHDTERAEALLQQAHEAAPEALSVYFSLYKFYFYKGRLADAERAARSGMETAARQAGFPPEFEELRAETADWTSHNSPQHFYLFSLKALSFIRLRQGDVSGCKHILEKLYELDKTDSVGASVIAAYAEGAAAA